MIYVFFAEGFEEIEALAPVDILRRANLDVLTVGIGSKTIKGAHGISVVCDLSENEVRPDESLTGIVLPGGMPGTANLEKSETVQSFIDFADEKNILIAAICAAPSILGHKGLLKDKNATCFPSFEHSLKGAKLVSYPVVKDGNIITAKGMGVAIDFSLTIAEHFIGKEKAVEIKESLQCKNS